MRKFLAEHPELLVLLAALLCYIPALGGPFQFDDFGVIVDDPGVHSWDVWGRSLGHGLRPLLKLSYLGNWLTGWGPIGFHFINLAIHFATILLTGLIIQAATQVTRARPELRFSPGALFAMALFAIHPIQTEAVTYICGRSASLMTLTYCGALLFYVYGVRTKQLALWALLSPLFFLTSVMIKETAVTFPLALLIWELCIEKSSVRVQLKRLSVFFGILLGFMMVAIVHPAYYSLLYDLTGTRSLPQAFAYQVDGIAYLLARLFAIQRLSILPGLGVQGPSGPLLIIESISLGIFSLGLFFYSRKAPLVRFGILWFFLHLLLPYLVVPRSDVLNEHHMYLANVGLFAAIGLCAERALAYPGRRQNLLRWAAGSVAVLLIAQTLIRNWDYRSEISLWEATIRTSAPHPRAFNNLGVAYRLAGRYEEARAAFDRALVLEPAYEDARINLERLPKRQ